MIKAFEQKQKEEKKGMKVPKTTKSKSTTPAKTVHKSLTPRTTRSRTSTDTKPVRVPPAIIDLTEDDAEVR